METTMASSPAPVAKQPGEPGQLNGVEIPALFATIDAVERHPQLARFRFRATNRWQQGTHSRSTLQTFHGAGGERRHVREFTFDADYPRVLVGRDQGPTPVEFLLHAIAACITAGIGNLAAAAGVTLFELETTAEGDIDLRGLLGISNEVRNGYEQLRVNVKIRGDASPEKLEEIVAQSRARSAVYDALVNGIPVAITVSPE